MNKRKYVKQVAVGIGMLMAASLVGCGGNVESNDGTTTESVVETTTDATKEVTIEPTTEIAKETEEITTESEEITTELSHLDYMTTQGYKPASEVLEDYEFTCEKNDKYRVYRGEYALKGEDKYEIIFTEDYSEGSYIEINGIKKELNWPDSVYSVGIIDLDTSDEYKEVAILDDGPSGDPSITFVRFDGKEIYDLGIFENGYLDHQMLFDGKGNIIESSGYLWFLEPTVVSEYSVLSGNSFVSVHMDYKKALNKTYVVLDDTAVAFGESNDTNIENGYRYIESLDDTIELKKGDEIKLIDFDLERELFYVQLPDGRIGYFTTCLAG